MSYYHLAINLPLLQLGMIKQEDNKFITDVVIRLNLPIKQREAINRGHMYL